MIQIVIAIKIKNMTDHIHLGNGTHAAYHNIDLDNSRGPTEVRSNAVVVTAK